MSTIDDGGPLPFVISRSIDAARKGFPVMTGENPSITLHHDGDECKHMRITIDARERTVTCDECRALLDAFDVLLRISSGEKRMQKQADIIEKERAMQRGFYDQKRTVKAQRCRHANTYPVGAGVRKCLQCDQVITPKSMPIGADTFGDTPTSPTSEGDSK